MESRCGVDGRGGAGGPDCDTLGRCPGGGGADIGGGGIKGAGAAGEGGAAGAGGPAGGAGAGAGAKDGGGSGGSPANPPLCLKDDRLGGPPDSAPNPLRAPPADMSGGPDPSPPNDGVCMCCGAGDGGMALALPNALLGVAGADGGGAAALAPAKLSVEVWRLRLAAGTKSMLPDTPTVSR